jgi:DNA mismatch repair protein MutS2
VEILQKAGNGALVVLDEIGAGTDPAEGAALAKAVLLSLSQRGVRTIASTHYAELKEFAWDREGFQNASVEFDVETLRPTYRLRIGVPGASNAITIAGRLGLPDAVLKTARENLGTDRLALEDAIARMEVTERRARQAAVETERKTRELEAQRKKAEEELQETRDHRREQTERAYETTLTELRAARDEAAGLLKQLREQAVAGKESEDARRRLQELDEAVRAKRPKPRRKPTHRIASGEAPQPGDTVWVPSLGSTGRLEEVRKDDAVVQAGALRLTVPYSTLQKVAADSVPPSRPEPSRVSIALRAAQEIPTEIHLRHMRADEALGELDRYFDDARLAGLHTVRIVHGKGTGALRTLVHRYLKEQPDVRGFRLGEDGEGGFGVTVVELK